MKTPFLLHPEAFNDLAGIWEFIATGSLDAADRVLDEIYDAIRFLADHPQTGHRRVDLTSAPLRFRRVYDYLIASAPEERPLLVLAVIHGRHSPRVMSAILRARG